MKIAGGSLSWGEWRESEVECVSCIGEKSIHRSIGRLLLRDLCYAALLLLSAGSSVWHCRIVVRTLYLFDQTKQQLL